MRRYASSAYPVILIWFIAATARADSGAVTESRFLQALDRGDTAAVIALLHPAARKEVDEPVLATWVTAMHERLGPHVAVRRIASSQAHGLTGTQIETTSDVQFERGKAEVDITVLDGQVIGFHVNSEQLADWFQGPRQIEPYDVVAQAFIRAFLREDSGKSRSLMHPALREAVSFEQLDDMIKKVTANGGCLKSMRLVGQRFSSEGTSPTLFVTYDIECERATGRCEIEFQFVGMKGYLFGFDFR
ncbi:MAG: hypothetical protein R3C10_28135 [Pirellulales bacterium]